MGGQATGTPLHPRPMGKHRPHAQLLADGRRGGGGERRFAPGVRAERPAGSAAGRERRGLCAGRAGCRGPETSPQVRPAPRCSPERHTLVRPERCPLRAGTWVPASGRTRTGWEVSREGVGGCRSPSAPGRREAAQGTLAGRCRHTCVCAAHTVPCHIAVTRKQAASSPRSDLAAAGVPAGPPRAGHRGCERCPAVGHHTGLPQLGRSVTERQ